MLALLYTCSLTLLYRVYDCVINKEIIIGNSVSDLRFEILDKFKVN